MSNDLAQIQAAINAATYRLDELEKAQATPANKQADEQQALLNKLKSLEVALHESTDLLRNDLIKESNRINDIKKEFKKEIELINGKIADLKNDSENVQNMIADILHALQNEIKNTVTKEFIAELYKKDNK